MDPTQRAKLGAHYTSREDILAVIEPVLMAPLRREWDDVRARATAEAQKATAESGRKAVNALQRAEELLYGFAERLRRVTVLDPACGSGNFLYVSLKELLDLEKEVSTFAGTIGLTPFFPGVSPEQLYGIETSPYAHELAQVVVWIGYLQWTVDNGFGTRQEPILGPMTNIREMDAILTRGEDGTITEPEWPEADVIVGNPPFLGAKKLRKELEDDYVEDLFSVYKARLPSMSDLVCYWFEKARAQIEDGKGKRAGLIATNSIRGGMNRRALERIKQSGDIFFAESDRPWILNGAAVRVSMVGFDIGSEQHKVLDGAPVQNINADLTGSLYLSAAKRLRENGGIGFVGDVKGGKFDVPGDLARAWLSIPLNPNGRPNNDVVRPWVNSLDVTRRNRDMWIVDFGIDMPENEAALYEAPFAHVEAYVKPARATSKRPRYRNRWWIHSEPVTGMRNAVTELSRYIVTPTVAKHRLFAWLSGNVLADHQLIVFARDDDYSFGVLHSQAHELWARGMGTWMGVGNDLRYTPTTCFETFPFPEPTDEQREEVALAAKRLDDLRRNWLNPEGASEAELKKRTLTNLYNARPTWFANAHAALDRAVFAAYGWPEDISDEEILKNLLALNLERSEEQGLL
jgi:type II restriction/modification system DNA methylase subunit YeeA